VLVVEDDVELQGAYRRRLERAEFEVEVATTVAGARALIDDSAQVFDAAVLDFNLPDGDSFELVTQLLDREPLCKSVVVTGVGAQVEARRYLQLGAHAFLAKPVEVSELVTTVTNTAHATFAWRRRIGQPGEAGEVAKRAEHEPPPVPIDVEAAIARLRHIADLSPLQTEVVERLLWGDSDREIATMLGCAERTAKRHVGRILGKTGARTRAALLSVLMKDAGLADRKRRD
jgi:DNA-binding NarL/FixJ family response regulator